MLKEIVTWLIGLGLVVLVGYGYVQQREMSSRYKELQQTELEIERMKEEIQSLEEKVSAARLKVQSLVSDPTEIEATIRQERQLSRPGEQVFRIEEAPAPVSTDSNTDSPQKTEAVDSEPAL